MPAPFQLLFDPGLSDLNPIEAGEGAPPSNHSIRPLCFNGTIIHHIRKGYGTLFVKDRAYPIGPDQAFIINPGEERFIHYVADHNDPWEYAWISFTGKLAPHFALLPPVFDMPKDCFPHIYGLKNAGNNISLLLTADLFDFYAKLVEPLLHDPDRTPHIIEYLKAHYMQKISITDIASHFGLDQRALCQNFKERTGLSVRAYLTQLRMAQAEALLLQNHSIKDVVELCGFGSISNFYQIFDARHDMTPLTWVQIQTERRS